MPNAGERYGEYILEAKVGNGAFGEVWRARHHVWLKQLVAVKIPTSPKYMEEFQKEGNVIHGLVHSNIVRAFSFDPFAEKPYLTMDYVPGASLRPYIEKKCLSISDTISIMIQVLNGLKYAHGRGVIHCDIKPENILIDERTAQAGFHPDGLVKITDFGLGKVMTTITNLESIRFSRSRADSTRGAVAGTMGYIAPELFDGQEPQASSDLYACGIILYEMLTGEKPQGAEMPSELNPHVPPYLNEVFRKSYARLANRFRSAEEFIKALANHPPLRKGKATSPPISPQLKPELSLVLPRGVLGRSNVNWRRLPCVLLLDTSGSMGETVSQNTALIDLLNRAIPVFLKDLCNDQKAKESVDLLVIKFGGKPEIIQDWMTPLQYQKKFAPLRANGDTPLGDAMNMGMDKLQEKLQEYSKGQKDFYVPWIFILTDARPTDQNEVIAAAANRAREMQGLTEKTGKTRLLVYAYYVESKENVEKVQQTLHEFTNDVYPLRDSNFDEMFRWLSASLKQSVRDKPAEAVMSSERL